MKFIIRLLLSTLAVIFLAKVLPGVTIDNYTTALWVVVALGVLNFLVKPVLIILTLPVTLLTFGLFLLIINACIILLADKLVPGFNVDNLLWALIFSLLLSFLQSILFSILKKD